MLQCLREMPSSSMRRSASPRPITVGWSGFNLCSSPTWGPESTSRNALFSSVARSGAGAALVSSSLSIDRGIALGLRGLLLPRARDVERRQPFHQRAPRDAQRLGRLGLVAFALGETPATEIYTLSLHVALPTTAQA